MPYLLVTTHIRLEAGPCIGGQNVKTPMISVSFSIFIFLNAQYQLLTKYSHSSSCIQCKIFGHSGKVTLSHMTNVVVGDIFLVWDTWSMQWCSWWRAQRPGTHGVLGSRDEEGVWPVLQGWIKKDGNTIVASSSKLTNKGREKSMFDIFPGLGDPSAAKAGSWQTGDKRIQGFKVCQTYSLVVRFIKTTYSWNGSEIKFMFCEADDISFHQFVQH